MAGVAAAATKVEDVPVVLNELLLLDTFGSGSSILDAIKRHYVQQWLVVISRSPARPAHTALAPRLGRCMCCEFHAGGARGVDTDSRHAIAIVTLG